MLKPSAPDPELIRWLWSDAGLAWAHKHLRPVNHAGGQLAEIKNDHECELLGDGCLRIGYSPYADEQIHAEMARYGISGVPGEWKDRLRRSE